MRRREVSENVLAARPVRQRAQTLSGRCSSLCVAFSSGSASRHPWWKIEKLSTIQARAKTKREISRCQDIERIRIKSRGLDCAPVDPLGIADSIGIVVQASNKLEGSFSGCLIQAGDSFGILYSTGIRNKGYQRFTVAHELGHYSLMDHHRFLFEKGALHRSESGFTSSIWYEREADLFSVELLIPEFLFHRHRKEFPLGLEGVKGLAAAFQTSLTAMGIRYATLCTEPVAVVMSEGDKILYSVLSKPFASELGLESRWAARSRGLPAKSVTRRLNVGVKVVSEERGVVKASEWFPEVSGELFEEVIGLGRYGKTLTVLTVRGQD